MSKRKKHLEVIKKRILCLKTRIANETTSETPAQKAELEALEWLLESHSELEVELDDLRPKFGKAIADTLRQVSRYQKLHRRIQFREGIIIKKLLHKISNLEFRLSQKEYQIKQLKSGEFIQDLKHRLYGCQYWIKTRWYDPYSHKLVIDYAKLQQIFEKTGI